MKATYEVVVKFEISAENDVDAERIIREHLERDKPVLRWLFQTTKRVGGWRP